jgi:hypothetical protein
VFLPSVLGLVFSLPSIGGTFGDEEASADFLQTFWQVVAGALGLSVAMVAFAFEAFVSTSQRRLGGTLREFAAETHLLTAIRIGVLALLVDGAVLLGIGSGAPGGWAAAWATMLSGATLAAVPFVLNGVVRAVDLDELLKMRRERLKKSVDEAMAHQLTGQASEIVLRSYGSLPIERTWVKPQGEIALQAKTTGELRDVRLGVLARLAMRLRRQKHKDRISLLVGLGDQISPDTEVLAMSPQATPLDRRRALRSLKIKKSSAVKPPDRYLSDQLSLLHGQAIRAAREGAVEEWRSISELYRLVLLALPKAAVSLGVPFEGAVAAPGVFGFGPAQRIADHLFDELEAALQAGHKDLVDAISYQPAMVAREAMKLDALALSKEMLRLYPAMYRMARPRINENDAAKLLLNRSTRYLVDSAYLAESPFEDQTSTEGERRQAAAFGRILFSQINAILKATIDLADFKSFSDLERKWSKMLEYELAYVVDERPEHEALKSLDMYRSVLRLGLAMWTAHLLRDAVAITELGDDSRVRVLRTLASGFSDADALLDIYEQANEQEERERGVPWTDWFLSELPDGEAHMIPTSSELIFTTALLLITQMSTDEGARELKPRPWLNYRQQELDSALERLRSEADRWSAIFGIKAESDQPIGKGDAQAEWLTRVERLENLLTLARKSASEYRKAQLRDAELDPERVATFRQQLLAATQKGRLIRDLFETQGALRRQKSDPTEEHMVSRAWLPKSLFIHDSNLLGGDYVARDLARATRHREATGLLSILEDLEPHEVEGELAERLRDQVREIASTGSPATLLLLPISWRLRQHLGLAMFGRGAVSDLIPVTRQTEFDGLFEGVPVLDSPYVPKDRLWLINLPSVGAFIEWPSNTGLGIEVELRSFSPDEAALFLRERPEVRPKGASDEDAVKTMQEQVLCVQHFHWRIDPADDPVGTCLLVPADLQH